MFENKSFQEFNDTDLIIFPTDDDLNCSTLLSTVTTSTVAPAQGTVFLVALRSQLKWGFLLHAYGLACLFFMLAFYAFFSILNLRALISSRPFMSTINGFLCLLGVSRAGCLFIDPYNLREAMPKVMGSVLWDVGFPCLTSAFCLIQLTFLQLTQSRQLGRRKLCELSHGATIYIVSPWSRVSKYMLNLGPEKLRRKSCLSLIITAHFSFIIGADIAVGFQDQLMIVKLVVQLVFLCWGIFLCCTFLYGGYRVMGLLRNMPGGLLQREPPDHNRKGIMQLALLAPYNNLASSVAAALVPTLLTPKIRITDENDRTFSYGSDSNSQPTDPNQQSNNQEQVAEPEVPARGVVRPGSPDPRRKTLPTVQVRPPTPVPSIVVSPGSRRSSLASRRGSEIGSLASSRRGSEVSRRGSEVSRRGSEVEGISGLFLGSDINRSRRGSESSSCSQNRHLDLARRGSNCSSLADIAEDEIRSMPQEELPPSPVSPTSNSARKKSLSWQKSNPSEPVASSSKEPRRSKVQIYCGEQSEDEVTAETSLLPRQTEPHSEDKGSNDLTLHSILNHIAYVNRAALPNQNVGGSAPTSRKSQVQRVLNATYITALLGVILCLFDAGRLCGPYGLLATSIYGSAKYIPAYNVGGNDLDRCHSVSKFISKLKRDATSPGTELRPWPWFCFQTICRLLEFAMGCAMANITKQPVNSRHQYLQQQYAYSLRLKQHRESLYI